MKQSKAITILCAIDSLILLAVAVGIDAEVMPALSILELSTLTMINSGFCFLLMAMIFMGGVENGNKDQD